MTDCTSANGRGGMLSCVVLNLWMYASATAAAICSVRETRRWLVRPSAALGNSLMSARVASSCAVLIHSPCRLLTVASIRSALRSCTPPQSVCSSAVEGLLSARAAARVALKSLRMPYATQKTWTRRRCHTSVPTSAAAATASACIMPSTHTPAPSPSATNNTTLHLHTSAWPPSSFPSSSVLSRPYRPPLRSCRRQQVPSSHCITCWSGEYAGAAAACGVAAAARSIETSEHAWND